MRIAILLGANPRSHQSGSITIIRPGKWRIVGENVIDSEIIVKNHSLQLSLADEFELIEYTGFAPEFIKRGREQSISVYAERI